jgi:hypothetical protein
MLKHTEGIVRREEHKWVPCDLRETWERAREDRPEREEQAS